MDSVLQMMYAGSVAASQFIVTFAQVRAQQRAMLGLSQQEIKELSTQVDGRRPIGFYSEVKN